MSKVLFSIPLDDHLQLHMLIYSRIGSIVSFIDGSLNFMLSSDVTHYPFQRTALKTTAAALALPHGPRSASGSEALTSNVYYACWLRTVSATGVAPLVQRHRPAHFTHPCFPPPPSRQ